MYVLTSSEAKEVENQAVERLSISIEKLMAKAGETVALEAQKMIKPNGRVVVFAGKGNNGGDGFVASKLLLEKGYNVKQFLLCPPEEIKNEAERAYKELVKTSVKPEFVKEEDIPGIPQALKKADLIIDAIFGFGFRGEIKGTISKVTQAINQAACPVLSVDIPSGLEADTGRVSSGCIKASKTATFTCPKVGMEIYPGLDFCGEIVVRDIGIPHEILKKKASTRIITSLEIKKLLPLHPPDIHKKSCGKVLVIAGSPGLTGAACLTATAALRSGAGLVTLGVPQSLNSIFEEKLTEVMTVPLPETKAMTLSLEVFDYLVSQADSFDVLVVGPGISVEEDTVSLVQEIVREIKIPLVIDADGLNAIALKTKLLSKRDYPTIITPHPGELGRLLQVDSGKIQSDRLGFAKRAAEELNSVVVLKGARSIIASGKESHINSAGNWGMATAGTGDVLTGLVSGLLAQGMELKDAAVTGTYLHGLAGDLAANEMSNYCLIAGDLIDYLPKAFREVID